MEAKKVRKLKVQSVKEEVKVEEKPVPAPKPVAPAKPASVAYFLTLFKIKDHKTWRASMHSEVDGFAKQVMANMLQKGTEVTEKKVYKIDRISGVISEQ